MVPAANTIGFAGQELARKLPKVLGVLIETTLGSLVEIILFIVLVVKGDQNIPVVRAAILGSILANLLLCMGLCFIVSLSCSDGLDPHGMGFADEGIGWRDQASGTSVSRVYQ
jgi:calcium/proton exchanger cax